MTDIPEIPGYRIEKELGQGGMARVFLAREEKLDRLVALKLMVISPTQDKSLAARFLKEARTAARLVHSNIVTIHDVGEYGGAYYMAMEYLPKGNLRECILSGALFPEQALAIVRQIALALHHAHEEGFVHRDIKPENILFRRDGTPVLADFGIAKATGSTTKLTKTGMSIGTPHYMSPEQARGQVVDGRSDLYSLGIVLYEMLIGKVPFDAEDSVAIAIKHIQEPVPQLAAGVGAHPHSGTSRAVPSELSKFQPLIDKLLAKNPADRVNDAVGLVRMIDEFAAARPVSPPMARQEIHRTQQPKPRQEINIPVEAPSDWKKPVEPKIGKSAASSQEGMVEPKRKKMIWVLAGILSVLVVVLYLVVVSKSEESTDSYSTGSSTMSLRSNFKILNDNDVKSMLKRLNFYNQFDNPSASGISHQYQSRTISGDRVVIDGATRLMWHQSGSDKYLNYTDGQSWLADLNRSGYAGYSDWRLPTLEEGASLLESSKRNGDLYIDPVFSNKQWYIWTGDSYSSAASWVVGFSFGGVHRDGHDDSDYVRPVRSGK